AIWLETARGPIDSEDCRAAGATFVRNAIGGALAGVKRPARLPTLVGDLSDDALRACRSRRFRVLAGPTKDHHLANVLQSDDADEAVAADNRQRRAALLLHPPEDRFQHVVL